MLVMVNACSDSFPNRFVKSIFGLNEANQVDPGLRKWCQRLGSKKAKINYM